MLYFLSENVCNTHLSDCGKPSLKSLQDTMISISEFVRKDFTVVPLISRGLHFLINLQDLFFASRTFIILEFSARRDWG